MSLSPQLLLLISVALLLASAFFVAAEYSLVSSRKTKVASLAHQGVPGASRLVAEMKDLPRLIAACQIGITMIGIAVGTLTEPLASKAFANLTKGFLDTRISFAIAFLVVSFVLVAIGELAPKYATLRNPERAAILLIRPISLIAVLFKPLIWLAEGLTRLVLLPFGIRRTAEQSFKLPREEILLMIQAGTTLEDTQLEVISRSLKIDKLCARDIMIHRLDVKWLDANLKLSEAFKQLSTIEYSRVPICNHDIDDVVGVVYVIDVIKVLDQQDLEISVLARPAIAVPENLSLDRILIRMRETNSQILIVMDEYGGTSGIITLEDLVEEIFGDLEDSTGHINPVIQVLRPGFLFAKAELRLDELAAYLGMNTYDVGTDSLATLLSEGLQRVPKRGDQMEFIFGKLKVAIMNKRRITYVEIELNKELVDKAIPDKEKI